MRAKIIAGNWKCFKTLEEARILLVQIIGGVEKMATEEVVICPPFLYLEEAVRLTANSPILIGAQNLWKEDWGPYTGEISAPMLASCGVKFVIIGHSERRHYFQEGHELLQEKTKRALAWSLRPIFCLGERLEERETGNTFQVVSRQLMDSLGDLSRKEMHKVIIAYEPVWAIGTGKNATAEEAQEVHLFLRSLISKEWGDDIASEVLILYGGSVKPDNIDSLMAMPDIDGALVGGASLKAEEFLRIVHFREVKR